MVLAGSSWRVADRILIGRVRVRRQRQVRRLPHAGGRWAAAGQQQTCRRIGRLPGGTPRITTVLLRSFSLLLRIFGDLSPHPTLRGCREEFSVSHGKDGVAGSIPAGGSTNKGNRRAWGMGASARHRGLLRGHGRSVTGDTGNLKDRTSDPTSLPPILARPSPLVAFLHLSHPTEVDPTPIVGILDKRSVSARSSPWAGHIPDLRTAVHLTAQVPVCQRRDGRSTPARLNRTLEPTFEPWAGAPTN